MGKVLKLPNALEASDYEDFVNRSPEQRQEALDRFWKILPGRLDQDCNPFGTVYTV